MKIVKTGDFETDVINGYYDQESSEISNLRRTSGRQISLFNDYLTFENDFKRYMKDHTNIPEIYVDGVVYFINGVSDSYYNKFTMANEISDTIFSKFFKH